MNSYFSRKKHKDFCCKSVAEVPITQACEVCLKSNGTVHAAQITFIAEKKALLFMMSQCLMVSKTKFQHSVTPTILHSFLQVVLSRHFLCDNLMKLRIFGFFFL